MSAVSNLTAEVVNTLSASGKKEAGLRFNEGKLNYELLEPYAMEQLVKIFTIGAKKYAKRNWEKGMSWTSIVASLKRHLAEFEKGEDYDKETGLLHMAHCAWNAMALTSYYKIAPQYDDRAHGYLNHPKIGLDIDDVICDWINEWCKLHNLKPAKSWYFSYSTRQRLEMTDELKEWYLNLPAKIDPADLPFEPSCYITARSIPQELTEQWIEKNGFPTVPIYTVPFGASKVDVAKNAGIDIFVDDSFHNFTQLNNGGICTYLLTTPHNKRYDVGHKRVDSLKEFFERFK